MEGYELRQAEHGGYYVSPTYRGDGLYRPVMFAGTLDECLAFIRKQFEPNPKQEGAIQ